MPVNTPHPDYLYRKPDWKKIRDFAEGARAVRAAGEVYLPKTKSWTQDEYNAYKARAEVYGALDRTVDGLDGAIFRKSPNLGTLDAKEAIVADVTLTGKTMTEWLRTTVRDILQPGRRGALVEFTGIPDSTAPNPNANVNAGGTQRPYVVEYTAEQIINWETTNIGGVTRLTMVVLEEQVQVPDAKDEFVKVFQTRYRRLRLVDGKYVVEIWTADTTAAQQLQPGAPGAPQQKTEAVFVKSEEVVPTRRGQPLNFIPFFFFGVTGQSIEPEKPPLLDIADLCILHYQTSADYAHGLHWVALPTMWATGITDKTSLAIGPSSALVSENENAKFGMLEFTGTGLGAVENRLKGLETKMAALGARILEEQKDSAESGRAQEIRRSGDASVLAGIADAVSRAAEAIVGCMLWWAGNEKPDVTIALNQEFFGQPMDPQALLALMQTWQAGGMSKETFLWNLKRGELMPEETTVEDEMAKLATEAPPGLMATTAPVTQNGEAGGTPPQ